MSDVRDQGSQPTGVEKRCSVRAVVHYELAVAVGRGNTFFTGLIKNISCGGIFVDTLQPHDIGEIVTLRFTFPGGSSATEVEGVVRWKREGGSSGASSGIGVKLIDLPPTVCDDINRYIEDRDVLIYE